MRACGVYPTEKQWVKDMLDDIQVGYYYYYYDYYYYCYYYYHYLSQSCWLLPSL